MPVDCQVCSSNSPRAETRTPATVRSRSRASRNVSLRTHSATATCSTPAPFGAASTTTPPSVQTCGTSQPAPVSARSDPAVSVTENDSAWGLAIDGLPTAGLLADLAGEVEPLERELDRAGALAVVAGV